MNKVFPFDYILDDFVEIIFCIHYLLSVSVSPAQVFNFVVVSHIAYETALFFKFRLHGESLISKL